MRLRTANLIWGKYCKRKKAAFPPHIAHEALSILSRDDYTYHSVIQDFDILIMAHKREEM